MILNLASAGPSTKCHRNACANGGTCVQQWNSYTCNCDMTSYTGPTCSDGVYLNLYNKEYNHADISRLLRLFTNTNTDLHPPALNQDRIRQLQCMVRIVVLGEVQS